MTKQMLTSGERDLQSQNSSHSWENLQLREGDLKPALQQVQRYKKK